MRASLLFAVAVAASSCLMQWTCGNAVDTACMSEGFLSDPPDEDTTSLVSRGQRSFSVNLIKSLFEKAVSGQEKVPERKKNYHNIFISPSSIFQTLLLAYFGSAGETEAELAKTMSLVVDGQEVNKELVKKSYVFETAYQTVREKNPNLGYTLVHANKLFFDRSLPLNRCITLLLNDELGAVDFANNPEKARLQINTWVENKTLKKIRDLLPSGAIDSTTKAALVNAAYFKGQWKSQFKPEDTKIDNFYVRRDVVRTVKFMTQKGPFNYYPSEELRAHVVQLPYEGESVSMVIILPPFEDGSLEKTVELMTPEKVQGVMNELMSGFYKADDLTVKMPKFHIEQSMDLSNALGRLGLTSLFDLAKSNLTNFLERGSDDRILLSSALHKSYIDVNEEGSEAAAATALFGFRSARPLFYKEFEVNHPFMFLIYDQETDVILFYGVYQDPKAV